MSIHNHLRQIPTAEIKDLGWSKALELAKVARSEGRSFDCAAWWHKVKESTKQQLKEEVYRYFTGQHYEPYEIVYFKLYESQLPIVERALYVASRMVGPERSRGYCLALACADFLAGDGGIITGGDAAGGPSPHQPPAARASSSPYDQSREN